MWRLHGSRERKSVRRVWVTWPRWPPRPYMVTKNFKNLLLRNQRANDLGAWYVALGTWAQQSLFEWWCPFFMARSNLLPYAFAYMRKYTFLQEKMLEIHLMEETYNKWPEWQKVYVDIILFTSRCCLPLSRGYIHAQKHEKIWKPDFKEILYKLATNGQSDKAFLLPSKLCPQGVVCPCPGAI